MLRETFSAFVENNNLIPDGSKTLLAVSGGMDSTAMTWLFHLTQRDFGIAHCNFNLRGEDSHLDEAFVKELAGKLSVPFFSVTFNTQEISKTTGNSIQVTARELRYQWLEKIREENSYDLIATAHHHDDNIETLLINLVRGTGIHGLKGIPLENGNIIRPLLPATRRDIEQFVCQHKIAYREDASNRENKYARNKLRNEVIPVMEIINPNFRDSFKRFFDHITLPYDCFRKHLEQTKKELIKESDDSDRLLIPVNKLKQTQYPGTILFEILKPYGFNAATIDDILAAVDKQPGKKFHGTGYSIVKDREYFILVRDNPHNNDTLVIKELPGSYELNDLKLSCEILDVTTNMRFLPDEKHAYLDIDKLSFPLKLRLWQNGDSFKPLGMQGVKKVSDFLIDKKIPVDIKNKTYVLCSGENIVWLAGYRIDDRYKIDKNSKRCLHFEVKSGNW